MRFRDSDVGYKTAYLLTYLQVEPFWRLISREKGNLMYQAKLLLSKNVSFYSPSPLWCNVETRSLVVLQAVFDINNDSDAEVSLQIANALTLSLLSYRMKMTPVLVCLSHFIETVLLLALLLSFVLLSPYHTHMVDWLAVAG